MDDLVQTVYDLLYTVTLFLGGMEHANVDEVTAENNLYFLTNSAQLKPAMQPRNASVVAIPSDYIQSGDFFGIIRLDGIDTMLGWAMGSSTGHTVVALRAPNNTLYLCESTTLDSYWPTNGVQCHEYDDWVALAVAADHNVVIAPLNPTMRAQFNATAAWEFYNGVAGLDYGYHNLLFGWIDTVIGNYPCLPPNYEQCLTWDIVEILFGAIDRLAPSVGDILFNQAMNFRMNTTGLLFADILMVAGQRGIDAQTIPTIVESDTWMYNTTRYGLPAVGKSEVCCTFVCNIWKAGGLFTGINNQVNCAEMTNSDDYGLNYFDPARIGANRPASCISQDPSNPLCQITGKYTLNLNSFNVRAPYPHMSEKCPSLAPAYDRPAGC